MTAKAWAVVLVGGIVVERLRVGARAAVVGLQSTSGKGGKPSLRAYSSLARCLDKLRDMKTSKLFAASFVALSAVGMAAPAWATTSKTAPVKAAVVSKSAKTGRQVEAKRAQLPRAWVWQKKAVKLDNMFAKR